MDNNVIISFMWHYRIFDNDMGCACFVVDFLFDFYWFRRAVFYITFDFSKNALLV